MGSYKKREEAARTLGRTYTPENEKPYLVEGGVKEDRLVTSMHASVVNSLQRSLRKSGFQCYNNVRFGDLKPDLAIPEVAVFEVKTIGDWPRAQRAVGQLRIYSQDIRNTEVDDVIKVAVLPSSVSEKIVTALEKDHIYIVKWTKTKSRFSFDGLNTVLPLIRAMQIIIKAQQKQ